VPIILSIVLIPWYLFSGVLSLLTFLYVLLSCSLCFGFLWAASYWRVGVCKFVIYSIMAWGHGDSFGFLFAFYLLFLGLSLAWTENICYSLHDNHEHFACKLAHLLIEIVLFLIAVSSPLLPTKLSILRTPFKA
jgi:hypothetical protein